MALLAPLCGPLITVRVIPIQREVPLKALAIVAVIFAGLSIFIPVVGVFMAMLCSVLALISFRTETTLSGIAFGINIINTAFLSPSIIVADVTLASNELLTGPLTESGDIYWFYVGFHVALLMIAIVWRMIKGAPDSASKSAPS